MRILIVANNFPRPNHSFDGIFNLRAAQALQAIGHEVRVARFIPLLPPFTRYGRAYRGLPSDYCVEGVDVHILRGVQAPRSFGMGLQPLQLRAQMRRLLSDFGPDIVHAHGLLVAGLIASHMQRPFVVTAHGSEAYRLPWMRPGLERLARGVLREANAVACVSEFVASHVRRLGRSDIEIIRNGANDRIFYPAGREEAREALGIERNRPAIAFAGQLVPAKGLAELAEAMRTLRDLHPQLLVAGEGPGRDAFAAALQAAGSDVRFFGSVNQAMLAQIFAACDVFTLPSHAEGLPTVICEAMNAGRTVVATDVGGIPEIVHNGETGFVVPARDANALADRLRAVMLDSAMRDRFEARGFAFAKAQLTWGENARRYDAVYRRVLAMPQEKKWPRAEVHAAV